MKELGFIVIVGYILATCWFAAYYNYVFAVTHGFIAWIFFGEFYASFKALFWPIVELLNL